MENIASICIYFSGVRFLIYNPTFKHMPQQYDIIVNTQNIEGQRARHIIHMEGRNGSSIPGLDPSESQSRESVIFLNDTNHTQALLTLRS